jgi:hypothetical protein
MRIRVVDFFAVINNISGEFGEDMQPRELEITS